METVIANQFTNDIAPLPERPQFLKVLCILTWVCSCLMFLQTIVGLAMQPNEEQVMEKIENMQKINPAAADAMLKAHMESSDGQRIFNAVLNLVALALSSFGALWMWRLKKAGFYIYIAGEVLPYFSLLGGGAALAAMASAFGSMGSTIMGAVVGIMIVFDIAFIIMYAVNLKHMNK